MKQKIKRKQLNLLDQKYLHLQLKMMKLMSVFQSLCFLFFLFCFILSNSIRNFIIQFSSLKLRKFRKCKFRFCFVFLSVVSLAWKVCFFLLWFGIVAFISETDKLIRFIFFQFHLKWERKVNRKKKQLCDEAKEKLGCRWELLRCICNIFKKIESTSLPNQHFIDFLFILL